MRVGVLGTGMVGRTIGSKLVELGHDVRMGARDAASEKAAEWVSSAGERASQGTFADAAGFGELVFNCTAGAASLDALALAGEDALRGKVLVDVANALDYSRGMPPSLTVCNTDSLGEQIQRAYPQARVVKALNTMNCEVMVDPSLVPGEHNVFVCGEDASAKAEVASLLESFGWSRGRIVDLGGIAGSRGTESYLLLWLVLLGAVGTSRLNIEVTAAG
jgi:predicted dinucleotide-binding enzyme